jgi:transposase
MTTDKLPKDWREGRRLQAWALKEAGWKQRAISEALGVSEGAVSQWIRRGRQGGIEALRHQPPPGAPSRLKAEEKTRLVTLLEQGAPAHGFAGQLWTCRRIAALIQRYFGVSYHRAHVSRLMASLGWTSQKPMRKAIPRDEAAIALWPSHTWQPIKKK